MEIENDDNINDNGWVEIKNSSNNNHWKPKKKKVFI